MNQQQSILAKLNELREDVVSFQTMQVNNNNNNNVNLQNENPRNCFAKRMSYTKKLKRIFLNCKKELLELKNESPS